MVWLPPAPPAAPAAGLDLGGGIGAERTAAAVQEAKGPSCLALLNAFLAALLATLTKDLLDLSVVAGEQRKSS